MDGEIYAGYFFDIGVNETNKKAAPNTDVVSKYIWGISLTGNFRLLDAYVDVSTLSDDMSGLYFHPASIRYTAGISKEISNFELSFEHQCWHPIDSKAKVDADVETYNQVMMRYKF